LLDTIVILLVALSLFLGYNHEPILVGSPVRSGVLSRKNTLILIIVGILLGTTLEGTKMGVSISIIENPKYHLFIPCILSSSLIVILLANLKKIPISLSQSLFGGIIAAYTLTGNFTAEKTFFILSTILSWLAIPILTLLSTYLIILSIDILVGHFGILNTYITLKLLTIVSVFYISYVFGANTLGFMLSFMNDNTYLLYLLLIGASVMGIVLAQKYIETKVSEEIYVLGVESSFSAYISTSILIEIVTQIGIPMSITQSVTAGLLGVIFTRKFRLPNIKVIYEVILQWILSPVISFILSILLIYALIY